VKVVGILQKEEAPILKLGAPPGREMRGAKLFEVSYVNPASSYCFPAPAHAASFPEVSFLLKLLRSR